MLTCVRCGTHSTASELFSCLPLTCCFAVTCSGVPAGGSATWPPACSGRPAGATCAGSCAQGSAGSPTATCGNDGRWSVVGSCSQGEGWCSFQGLRVHDCQGGAHVNPSQLSTLLLLCFSDMQHCASWRQCHMECCLQREGCWQQLHRHVRGRLHWLADSSMWQRWRLGRVRGLHARCVA